jgi:hypothetical protein
LKQHFPVINLLSDGKNITGLKTAIWMSLCSNAREERFIKYLAQHRGAGNELRFFFSKGASSPRIRREQITTKQAGGYLVLQEERTTEPGGAKVKFSFF